MSPEKAKRRKGRGTGLKFLRIGDFSLIPRHLLEAVEPKDCDTDAVYAWGPAIASDPATILGVFVDADLSVKGFLWATRNPLDRKIHVQMLSVDNAYRGRGIVRETRGILDRIRKEEGGGKITFRTTRPEIFAGRGFARSRCVIMEEV